VTPATLRLRLADIATEPLDERVIYGDEVLAGLDGLA